VFAWTQTRFHLPVWLGIGEALTDAMDAGKLEVCERGTSSAAPVAATAPAVVHADLRTSKRRRL
jgi:hypothetical protein